MLQKQIPIVSSYVNGSEIEVGEYTVTATWEHDDDVIVTLTIDGEQIETTPWHPFYTTEGWTDAGDLTVGDSVYSLDGTTGTVEAVVIEDRTQTMYDLTVDEVHTFAVGEGEWVVHNTTPVPNLCGRVGRTWQYTEYQRPSALINPVATGRLPRWFHQNMDNFEMVDGLFVPVINGQKPSNYRFMGRNFEFRPGSIQARLYPQGVDFDLQGFSILDVYALNKVRIPNMAGNHTDDFIAANLAAGFIRPNMTARIDQINAHLQIHPSTTWHHLQDLETMLLIPSQLHNPGRGGVSHTGGVSLLKMLLGL